MLTKDQERKALEQIKKIIEGLGPGSYLKGQTIRPYDGLVILHNSLAVYLVNIDD